MNLKIKIRDLFKNRQMVIKILTDAKYGNWKEY